jgi:hypothetical protein
MKEWFKYEYGYVNVDDECLYLTNSGNWEEARKAEESKENSGSGNLIYAVALFGIAALIVIWLLSISTVVGTSLLALLAYGFYSWFNYLKTGVGASIKIPKAKLLNVEADNQDLIIKFLNGKDRVSFHRLIKVDPKGHEIMDGLQQNISKQS